MGNRWHKVAAQLVIALTIAGTRGAAAGPTLQALDIAAGDDHSCALLSDRTVRCWGGNDRGQLGAGSMALQLDPQVVPGVAEAEQIIAGWNYSCARLHGGAVRCWGRIESLAARGGSRGTELLVPARDVPLAPDVRQVAAGAFHVCALHASGKVSCWGRNDDGQLGRGRTSGWGDAAFVPGLDSVVELALGNASSCARLATGEVRCWGRAPDSTVRVSPTPVAGLTRVRQLTAGDRHTCALVEDGTVWCWGYDGNGRLGHRGPAGGSPAPVVGLTDAVQIAVSSTAGCAARGDGSVWCWGDGQDFAGPAGSAAASDGVAAGPVPELADVVEVRLASDIQSYLCVRHRDGTISCGGQRYLFPVTASQPRFRRVAGLSSVRGLAVGVHHQCVLQDDQRVACWGDNGDGQIGQPPPRPAPPVVVAGLTGLVGADGALVAGWKQTCLLGGRAAGVYCWGAFRPAPLRLDTGGVQGNIVELALAETACVRTDQSRVQCFADSWLGTWRGADVASLPFVLGRTALDAPTALAVSDRAACAVQAGSRVTCWNHRTPPAVLDSVAGARAIALRRDGGGCALAADGRVVCWSFVRGDDGDGFSEASPVPALRGARSLALEVGRGCALMPGGTLQCWDGELPDRAHPMTPLLTQVIKVVAGLAHSCALRTTGEVLCWGLNSSGQLGTGQASSPRASPVRVALTALPAGP